jgi:DNA-binding LacI/PurR family transcriptional regulator
MSSKVGMSGGMKEQAMVHGGRSRTMQEVAQLAGVSQSTVSRVINGSPKVSDRARAAVERVIAEVEYVPNMAARNLAQQRSDSVAVVIPDPENLRFFSDPFFPTLLTGISAGLRELDLQLILLRPRTQQDYEREQAFIGAGHVGGAMLVGLPVGDRIASRLASRGVPLVVVGVAPDQTVSNVDCDNRDGGRQAAAHLAALGRRRIATITGPLRLGAAMDRLEGFRDGLRAAGLTPDPRLEIEGVDFSAQNGVDAALQMLERTPDVDGVFAANDVMAAAAMTVFQDAGRLVPDDVAIVGFDDSVVAQMTRPRLSSVRQPVDTMGREMAHVLVALITDPDRTPRHVKFATNLVIRESSAASG